jgi:hypothetical protein
MGDDSVARKAVNEARVTLRRERPRDETDQIDAYVSKVGKANVEWNELSAALFGIFWALVGGRGKRPRDLATALWNMTPSDDHQRRLLRIFAEATLFDRKPLLARIGWLLKSIGDIAQYRNIGTHLPIEFTEWTPGTKSLGFAFDGVRPSLMLSAVMVEHYEPKFWDLLRGDLYALSQFAGAIGLHIAAPQALPSGALPYKPRLRSLPAMKLGSQIVPKSKRPKRKRRRRALKR